MGRIHQRVGSGPDFSEADPGIQLRGHYGERFRGPGGEAGAKPVTLKDIHFFDAIRGANFGLLSLLSASGQMWFCVCHWIRAGGRTPRTPRSGGPHACSGASCCVGEPFWAHQNEKNLLVAGAPPRTPLGKLTALPQTPVAGGDWGGDPRGFCCPLPKNPTYNIVIVLVLCICTHVHV